MDKFKRADVLSRLIGSHTKSEDILEAAREEKANVHTESMDAVSGLPVTFQTTKEATQMDSTLRRVWSYILT